MVIRMSRLTVVGFAMLLSLCMLLLLAECATPVIQPSDAHAQLALDSVQEISVVTSGASVACNFVKQPFAGQILYRTSTGERVPGTDIQFWKVSSTGEPELMNIRTDGEGRFDTTVILVNHEVGSSTLHGHVAVTLRASSCRPKELRVDDSWRSRAITLRCSERGP